MFDNTLLLRYVVAEVDRGTAEDVSGSRQQAASRFWQLYLAAQLVEFWARLAGRSNSLKGLERQNRTPNSHYLGLRDVPLNRVVGSEGRSRDFDKAFRPLQAYNRDRWVSIAVARRMGTPLPPVYLIQVGGDYYVRDGHHRISVAKHLGQLEIEAEVTVFH